MLPVPGSATDYFRSVCVVGFIGPGACLVATGYIECNKAAAVSMIVIAVGLSGVSMAGWAVNHLDLAPPFAGMSLCGPPTRRPYYIYIYNFIHHEW